MPNFLFCSCYGLGWAFDQCTWRSLRKSNPVVMESQALSRCDKHDLTSQPPQWHHKRYKLKWNICVTK
ncbi:hypothetical protein J6590_059213 [Homalodisca vitripennis]|nr:hypothetical protein J6590_059213 [Homalodisca vitripennis]